MKPHFWWSSVYPFMTGLPPSNGKITILNIVDLLSKMVHFVTLPKLLSAKEVLAQEVFWLYGFPLDIVSKINQALEVGLMCLCAQDPSLRAKSLLWVKYAHNSLPSSATW